MIELKISTNEAHQRLDRFLRKYLKDHPLGEIYKHLRTGKVKVNDQKEPENFMLTVGDRVQLFIDDIAVHQEKAQLRFDEKSEIINIVFEDENLLVVNKPIGMLTHPDKESDKDTLVDRVHWYLRKVPGTKSMTFAPSACNRLDRNTAGLVLVAKNYATLRLLNKMIRERKISKYYLCVVKGMVKKDGEIKETLVKDEKRNKTRFGRPGEEDAKDSHTIYKVLMRNNNYSLLEVELVTGRPHQIRAHFSGIGHPLYGDVKYGGGKEPMDSQLLFAFKVHFNDGEDHLIYLKDKNIESPLPKDFQEVIGRIFDKNRDTVKKTFKDERPFKQDRPVGNNRPFNQKYPNSNKEPINTIAANNYKAPIKQNAPNNQNASIKQNTTNNTNAPIKQNASNNSNAPIRQNVSNNPNAPLKQNASNNSNVPIKQNASNNPNAPIRQNTPINSKEPVNPNTPVNQRAPINQKAPINPRPIIKHHPNIKEHIAKNEQSTEIEIENVNDRVSRQNGGKPGFYPNNNHKRYNGNKNKRGGNFYNNQKKVSTESGEKPE